MKKKIFLAMTLMAALVSCTEDYKDWATPQTVEQPATVTFANGSLSAVDVIKFADFTEDQQSVKVCNITAPTSSSEAYTPFYTISLGGTSFPINADGTMALDDLVSYVESTYGKAPNQRDITATVSMWLTNGVSTVKTATSGEFLVKALPDAPFIDPNGYYVVGNIDGWTCTRVDAYHMINNGGDPYANPEFNVTISAVKDITTYEVKFVPSSAFNESGTITNWDIALSALPGTDIVADEGTFSYNNAGGNIKFAAQEGAKNYQITINLMEGTYKVKALSDPELFMTGNNLGWGATWLKMFAVNSNWDDSGNTKGIFWIIRYFQDGEQFKFSPEAAWSGDFGGNQMSVTDEAGAGYVDDGTNCKVEKGGWYQIVVDTKSKDLTISKPKVYLCGEIVDGGWNAAIPDEANRFTEPAGPEGEFVSPAFTNDGKVRMFTHISGIDWWRCEYNVFGTTIVIRTEGDQDGVNGTAGQKAYLNFATMTGSIK